ncbi:Rrf2 family transcriptional regulator [Paraburkholderia sp. IW21]|uniref:Rrf2 family transcriptional regulator n=1 Tax=Paraburkholderia sp. IW21 TaxID=3242488 RepID=UPI0035201BE6
MRLTDSTDYTLRALMYLRVRDDRLATIEEIAQAYGLSRHHMSKIIGRLVAIGWVEGIRGRSGGVRLAHNARDLTVGAVVRATEPDFALASCHAAGVAAGRRECAIVEHCRLQHILLDARDAFLAELDTCTLEDLATPAQSLAAAFGLGRLRMPDPSAHDDTDRHQTSG